MDIDAIRGRLDEAPADDDLRADLARALASAGDKEAAAEAWYLAACGARKRGRDDLFRQRLHACLEQRPDWPLLFLEPPDAAPEPRSPGARILVVHPESRVRGPLTRLLLDHGYLVDEAATVGSARAVLRESAPDVVITAPDFLDGDAYAVASAARKARRRSAVVLLTCAARGELPGAGDRVATLVDEHLDRPLAPARLLESVAAALWRHRHATPVPAPLPEPRHDAPGLGTFAPLAGRAVVVVAAGYALVFALHFWLESSPAQSVEPRPTLPPAAPRPAVPAELTPDDERMLWTRLTATERNADFEVQVTSITPDLVAARAYRQARRRGQVGALPTPEVERALAALRADELATFEVHVSSRGAQNFDPLQTASSVRLELDSGMLRPVVPPAPDSLRFVRESEREGDRRTRSLHFRVAFTRSALAQSDVVGLTLDVAGAPHVVYVARTQLGGP